MISPAPATDRQPAPCAAVLEAVRLSVAPRGVAPPVLEEVNLRLPQGALAVLAGANGCGKTTLLKTFAGMLPPIAGAALVHGSPAQRGTPRVARLAQRPEIEWTFPVTVREAILAGRFTRLGWFRRPSQDDLAKADDALCRLGLETLADRPIGKLSGGQRQRVLLARALCQEADILLLDEPFAALDIESRTAFETFLASAPSQGLTVFLAAHDLADTPLRFSHVFQIRDRRLAEIRVSIA